MGALRTYLAIRTMGAVSSTAAATNALVDHADEQELRARGLIGPYATPAERAAAVRTVRSRVAARQELAREAAGRRWPYLRPAAISAFVMLVAVLCATDPDGYAARGGPLPFLVLGAAVSAVVFWHAHRREGRRARLLDRAAVRDGRCGWCDAPAPHLLEGVATEPRVYHAAAIRQALR